MSRHLPVRSRNTQDLAPHDQKRGRPRKHLAAKKAPHSHRFHAFVRALIAILALVFLALTTSYNKTHFLFETLPGKTEEPSGSHEKAQDNSTNCLDPDGPKPIILLSRGRSASSNTFRVIGTLTGQRTESRELTGGNKVKSREFFRNADLEGRWMFDFFCKEQKRVHQAGVVGFKWKPFDSIYSPAAQAALKAIAASRWPTIKVVRLHRNPLDVLISNIKHNGNSHIRANCPMNDESCIKKHLEAGTNLILPTENLLETLHNQTNAQERIDQMLMDLSVPHIQVTYEALYCGKNPEEHWMKIFQFLGVGPGEGLTKADLAAGMQYAATSNPSHNMTLANYNEVEKTLRGTTFERLLH